MSNRETLSPIEQTASPETFHKVQTRNIFHSPAIIQSAVNEAIIGIADGPHYQQSHRVNLNY